MGVLSKLHIMTKRHITYFIPVTKQNFFYNYNCKKNKTPMGVFPKLHDQNTLQQCHKIRILQQNYQKLLHT